MSSFDLIPNDYREQMRLQRSLLLIGAGTAIVILVLLLVWGLYTQATQRIEEQLPALRQRDAQLQFEKAQFESLVAAAKTLEQQQRLIASRRNRGTLAPVLLAIDSALLPGRVQLTELRLQQPDANAAPTSPTAAADADAVRISLRGRAIAHTDIALLTKNLQASTTFANVRLGRAEKESTAPNGASRFNIELLRNNAEMAQ